MNKFFENLILLALAILMGAWLWFGYTWKFNKDLGIWQRRDSNWTYDRTILVPEVAK